MKTRFFSFALLAAALSFSSCGEKRTDGTSGEAVSTMDEAAAEGGVEADATVIDNEAGPTVTASPDSVMAADSSTMAQ